MPFGPGGLPEGLLVVTKALWSAMRFGPLIFVFLRSAHSLRSVVYNSLPYTHVLEGVTISRPC